MLIPPAEEETRKLLSQEFSYDFSRPTPITFNPNGDTYRPHPVYNNTDARSKSPNIRDNKYRLHSYHSLHQRISSSMENIRSSEWSLALSSCSRKCCSQSPTPDHFTQFRLHTVQQCILQLDNHLRQQLHYLLGLHQN